MPPDKGTCWLNKKGVLEKARVRRRETEKEIERETETDSQRDRHAMFHPLLANRENPLPAPTRYRYAHLTRTPHLDVTTAL